MSVNEKNNEMISWRANYWRVSAEAKLEEEITARKSAESRLKEEQVCLL